VEGCPLDEAEGALIERARHGDVAAYEELVRRYQDLAFRVAHTITGSADEAADAAQEGFVRAYRALGRFRDGAPFRPWLLTIVGNVARTRRVAVMRHPTLTLAAAVDRPSDDSAQSPEAAVLVAEERRELLAAVNALRANDQRVIACRYFLQLSEAETAGLLGCARGTVKSRLSRALRRLRQEMAGRDRAAGAAMTATTVEMEMERGSDD
jgi:RNA polymerase sigma-70 factor (ECF subfamily)